MDFRWIKIDRTHLLITVSFLLMAYLSETTVVTGDSSYHLVSVKFIATHGHLPTFEPVYEPIFWYPPLFHVLAASVYAFFSAAGARAAEFAVLLVNPIFGVTSLIIASDILKRLFGDRVRFYGTAFIAFLPMFIGIGSRPMVDMLVMLLLLLALRYALLERPVWSGIFLGLSLLTKYQTIFMFPSIFLIFWTSKNGLQNTIRLSLSAGAVGIWWFVRNWLVLGNPLYPFFPNVFGGRYLIPREKTLDVADVGTLMSSIKVFFLEVMEGSAAVPKVRVALIVMGLMLSVLFFVALLGLIKSFPILREKRFQVLNVIILSHSAILPVYYLAYGGFAARVVLILFLAIAAYFGIGAVELERILQNRNMRLMFALVLMAIFSAFSAAMLLRSSIINSTWQTWQEDITWVKQNTKGDAFFIVIGVDSMGWQIRRDSLNLGAGGLNATAYIRDWIGSSRPDYLFVTQSGSSRAGRPTGGIDYELYLQLGVLPEKELVYYNQKSSTTIYRFIKRTNATGQTGYLS